MKKYFVNYNNYSFVFTGICYGYLKKDQIIISTEIKTIEIDINEIKFIWKNMEPSNKKVCIFSKSRFKEFYSVELGSIKDKLGLYIHTAFPDLPDIILPSEYCLNVLYKLIKKYNEEMGNK